MGKPGHDKDSRGKKLSWTYRNKKKRLGKPLNVENDESVQVQNKNGRIIVRNLSFKVTEADVRQLYEPFGEIEEINLLRRPDGKPVGCGFVQFKRVVDASKAIFNTNKKELLGRPINSKWATSKDRYCEKVTIEGETKQANKDETNVEGGSEGQKEERAKEGESSQHVKKKKPNSKKVEERKLKRLQKRKKRARIVVRNLSFKASDENLKEHFLQYGNIEDIRILTKADGTHVGCAFVQFELVQSAAKAIHYSNLKLLLDREIIVDWAVPKSKYGAPLSVKYTEIDITKEKEGEEKAEDQISVEVKEEPIFDEEKSMKDDSNSEDNEKSLKCEEDDSEDDKEEDEEDAKEQEEEEKKVNIKEEESKPRWVSNDVSEGRTVFLKNVPFQAKNEDLKACMEQFGPVFYALVCVDYLTEHSKGTAFVKFRNVEDAEKCLSAGTELRLFDQVLDPHRALHKNEVEDQKNFKCEKIKDSRNLYLVKEGVILARHNAAVGVSAQDIEKRLQLEQWKSQMLRNLNMFVSRVRLVVHNLPPTLDDAKLRQLCKNHSGPNAVITEARVMRNLRKPDANGVGESKEYAFVTFTKHEDALKALRSLNNNPNIFSKNRRPIVAFSIENRVMVNAKQKRITKSREHNPLWTGSKDKGETPTKRAKWERSEGFVNSGESYQGITSNPTQVKEKATFKVEKQAGLYKTLLKNQKRDKKTAEMLREKKMREAMSRKEIKIYKMSAISCLSNLAKPVLIRGICTGKWLRTLETFTTIEEERQQDVSHIRPYSEMPGPKPIPIFGNTWRFLPFIGDYNIQEIDKVSKRLHQQYGDVVKMEGLLNRPDMVFLYDANEIERLFRQEEKMPYRPSMPSLHYYKHVLKKVYFQDSPGLIGVHGESWYKFRSKVQQVMLQPRTARMYISAIEEASHVFLERIEKIKNSESEVPGDFLNEIHKWALESIARIALDVRLGCLDENAPAETQDLINAVTTFFKNVGILELKIPFWKIFSTPTWRQFVSALDVILNITSRYTKEALERAKAKTDSKKELSLLERVVASEKNPKLASILALDLFLVGIDTTSNSVASVLYQLAIHPEKQALVREEICKVLPSDGQPLEAKHIDDLKYLKACIRETLRMYPVVIGNGRCTTKDTVIGGYQVPKGVHVVFQHYVISNQDRYFPRSKEFLPERWLCGDKMCHPFASLPFGYGKRMCIGRRFAELEMIIVMSKIMQAYKVEYNYQKLDYYINPMYSPNGPLKIKFVKKY